MVIRQSYSNDRNINILDMTGVAISPIHSYDRIVAVSPTKSSSKGPARSDNFQHFQHDNSCQFPSLWETAPIV